MNNNYLLTIKWSLIILYLPVYISAWLLRIVARFLLAIAYFGILEGKMGKDILTSIFSFIHEKKF